MKRVFVVDEEDKNKRLDIFLSENLPEITRSQIKRSIEEGKTLVAGRVERAGKLVKKGELIEFEEADGESDILPENLPLEIVFEDDSFAVINKSQGMTVHPAPGNYTGTLVNALLFHFDKTSEIGGRIRPGIVHRIDKNTSGLIVIAKDNLSHLDLAEQIAKKTCRRTYYALCEGVVKNESGVISTNIGRSLRDRKKMAVVENGKIAVTHFEVLERFDGYTLVKFDLETGRTHQIRVHASYIGHPIVGDDVYGYAKQKFKLDGQLLHAKRLQLVHPRTKQVMTFECDLPDYFERILTIVRKNK